MINHPFGIQPIYGDDWGMAYYSFTHNLDIAVIIQPFEDDAEFFTPTIKHLTVGLWSSHDWWYKHKGRLKWLSLCVGQRWMMTAIVGRMIFVDLFVSITYSTLILSGNLI